MILIDENCLSDEALENFFMLYYTKVDRAVVSTEEYRQFINSSTALEMELMPVLSKEDKLTLEKLLLLSTETNDLMRKGYFKEGVNQGVKLMLEIYSSK